MKSVQRIAGIAAPLPAPNIDTEVMIRVTRLMEHGKGELGAYVFEPLRTRADGSDDPDFILNQPAFRNASILVAGDNFGCGSSREAAVWALADAGIGCIIAPSFGDIFAQNCLQNGVLAITLSPATVLAISRDIDPVHPRPMLVDLVACAITTPGDKTIPFAIDPTHRRMLLEGADEIDLTLTLEALIAAQQAEQAATMPWLTLLTRSSY